MRVWSLKVCYAHVDDSKPRTHEQHDLEEVIKKEVGGQKEDMLGDIGKAGVGM